MEKSACKVMLRLKTSEEMGRPPVETDSYAGTLFDPSGLVWQSQESGWLATPTQPRAVVALGRKLWGIERDWFEEVTTHEFPNTGMIRSWCKCGCEGTFDWISGEYKVLTPKESAA